MSGYGPVPSVGSSFPCLTGDGGRMVVVDPDTSTIEAARVALYDWAGHEGSAGARLGLLGAAETLTLRRVLVCDALHGDLEPGMWCEDGSGAQSIDVVYFTEAALNNADRLSQEGGQA